MIVTKLESRFEAMKVARLDSNSIFPDITGQPHLIAKASLEIDCDWLQYETETDLTNTVLEDDNI